MATPPSAAHAACRQRSTPRSRPKAAHTAASVAAPNAQRQKTTSSADCPDCTTNQPIVPEMTMAPLISSVPCVFLSITFTCTLFLDAGSLGKPRAVGVSAPSVSEGPRRFEARGVIHAFTLDIEPRALGCQLQATARVRPLPGQLSAVEQLIRDTPRVLRVPKGDRGRLLSSHGCTRDPSSSATACWAALPTGRNRALRWSTPKPFGARRHLYCRGRAGRCAWRTARRTLAQGGRTPGRRAELSCPARERTVRCGNGCPAGQRRGCDRSSRSER